MGLFGSSESAVRALSAVLGVMGVVAVYAAAHQFFPDRPAVARFAGMITALSPLGVSAAQMVRMYTLSPLLALLCVMALDRALARSDVRWMVGYATLAAMGLYTHNYFVFLLPVGIGVAWVAPGGLARRTALRWTTVASLLALAAYLPWAPVLWGQMGSGVSAWIEPLWSSTPAWSVIPHSIEVMGVGAFYPDHLGPLAKLRQGSSVPLLWSFARGFSGVLVVTLLALGVRAAARGRRPQSANALVVFLLLPLVLPWLVSVAWRPIFLVGRYETLVFPAFALLLACGMEKLVAARPSLGTVAIGSWCALAVLSLVAYHRVPIIEDERQSAAWILANARPHDTFVFPGYARAVPEYYLRRAGFSGARVSFPLEVGQHMGWFDVAAAVKNPRRTQSEALALAEELRGAVSLGGRVFVLDVDRVARRSGVTDLLRRVFVAKLGNERAIPSARVGLPPPVYVFGEP